MVMGRPKSGQQADKDNRGTGKWSGAQANGRSQEQAKTVHGKMIIALCEQELANYTADRN